jgi:hypothetical protein
MVREACRDDGGAGGVGKIFCHPWSKRWSIARSSSADIWAAAWSSSTSKHVFGVPGDYALRLLDLIEESDMDLVDMRHVSDQVRFSP